MLPNGVNIPMPKPYGGPAPVITRAPREDGTEGEIISVQFVGEIGPITQYLEFIEVLDTATPKDEVRILIDSPGGDVYTTQQLVGRMESCKAKVTTVASGLVASAATFLWFYGQEREVDRWARFMFHSSLHGDWGKSLAIKENATELVNYMSNLLTAEMKAGILLAEEVRKILVDKADVELAGATVKARLQQIKAGEGAVEPEGQPATEPAVQPAETPVVDPNANPAEGQPAAAPATEPVTPTEPVVTPTEPAAAPAVEPATEPAATPAEGGEEVQDPVLDLANLFAEELGIESPEPVKTPDNQPTPGGEPTTTETAPEPVTTQQPEAKCGGGAKKPAAPAKKAAPAPAKKAAPVKAPAKKAAPAKQKLYKKVVKDDGSEEFVELPEEETPAVAPAPTEPAPAVAPVTEPVPATSPVEPATTPATEPATTPVEPVVTPTEPATPATTPVEPAVAQPGEGETTPAVPGEIKPEETPAEGGEAPEAKCGKGKKKAAKRKAIAALFQQLSDLITEGETAETNEEVTDPAEAAKPEQNKEVPGMGEAAPGGEKAKEAGQTEEVTNTPKEEPVFDIAGIFAEELGEPAPVVTPVDPTEPKTEGATEPAQVPATEPVVNPAETVTTPTEPVTNQLPGEGQPNDPVKTDPGTEIVAPEKDAKENANAEVVAVAPRSRYW